MKRPAFSLSRVLLALGIAFVADAVQVPLTALLASVVFAVPAELAILFVDLVAATLLVATLGFDWLLLPAIALEAFPLTEVAPTWLLCAALVVWKRYRQLNSPGTFTATVSLERGAINPPPLIEVLTNSPPQPVVDADSEARLAGLQRLLHQRLITQTEFDTRRREILSQL